MVESSNAALPSPTRTENTLAFDLDEELYPVGAIYAASYAFIDRCFVCVTRTDATHLRVALAARGEIESQQVWDSVAREFTSELLAAKFRAAVTRAHSPIMDSVLAQALAGDPLPVDPAGDAFGGDDDFDADLEDPLGIAQSWEEKYSKKSTPDSPDSKDSNE